MSTFIACNLMRYMQFELNSPRIIKTKGNILFVETAGTAGTLSMAATRVQEAAAGKIQSLGFNKKLIRHH